MFEHLFNSFDFTVSRSHSKKYERHSENRSFGLKTMTARHQSLLHEADI